MNNSNLSMFIKNLKVMCSKHSPEILTGIGIAGMITTTVMAVRATPKALILIEERKAETASEEFGAVDVIKAAWKCYIPTVVIGSVSVLCIIGANTVSLRRHTALATAYTLSESALKQYQEKVVETIGEKKEQSVRDEIAKDEVNKPSFTNKEVIITGRGNTLCYDVISGRRFESDIDKLKKAENELNRRMRDEMFISLNDFYYEIGLEGTKLGDDLGWDIDKGYIDLNFSSQLTSDGIPCLVIDYTVTPKYGYLG